MISSTIFKPRKNRIISALLIFAVILVLSSLLNTPYLKSYDGEHLSLKESFRFPMSEISGMTAQPSVDQKSWEIHFVGDHESVMKKAKFDLDNLTLQEQEETSFRQAVLDHFPVCDSDLIPECRKIRAKLTSQWEGIYKAGADDFYLLHEQLAMVLVYKKSLNAISSVIELTRFDLAAKKPSRKERENSENYLGEGLLPLSNGHILIAKQKFRASIIEFGPEGESAKGYTHELAGQGDIITRVQHQKFVPLKIWTLPSDVSHCDLNELGKDPSGNLYALSSNCKWLAKISPLSPSDDKLQLEKIWFLPPQIQKAESFVFMHPYGVLVASDLKTYRQDNVFFLTFPPTL